MVLRPCCQHYCERASFLCSKRQVGTLLQASYHEKCFIEGTYELNVVYAFCRAAMSSLRVKQAAISRIVFQFVSVRPSVAVRILSPISDVTMYVLYVARENPISILNLLNTLLVCSTLLDWIHILERRILFRGVIM